MKKNPVRPLRPSPSIKPVRTEQLRDVAGGADDTASGQATGKRQHLP